MLLELFLSFMQVGLFSIGGGYAAIPLIQNQVSMQHAWLTLSEFSDLVTIAEMTPGPIAINAATFVGTRVAGLPGALVATLGCILPGCAIVSLLALAYRRWRELSMMRSVMASLRPAIVALIASAGLSILRQVAFGGGAIRLADARWPGLLIFAAAFFALRRWKPSPILVMCACGALGLGVGLITG